MTIHQKTPKPYFESRFFMSEIVRFFFSFKNINLGDNFLLKTSVKFHNRTDINTDSIKKSQYIS